MRLSSPAKAMRKQEKNILNKENKFCTTQEDSNPNYYKVIFI